MQKKQRLSGLTALITGASGGIGREIALYIASMGADLILVARNGDKLKETADMATEKYGAKSEIITADLSREGAAQKLYDEVKHKSLKTDILINNAGYGLHGFFNNVPLEKHSAMLRLNIIALTELTGLFLEDMKKRNSGHILLTASTAAFQATPDYADYGASKAFVLHFGEALRFELKKQNLNIGCTVLCPGPTATSFFKTSEHGKAGLIIRLLMMKPDKVARIGVKAMLKNKPFVISGFWNKVMAFSSRFMPRRWVTAVTYGLMKSKD